jgi:hypothetical protein
MAASRKRQVRQKGLRLLREASRNILAEKVKASRATANVVALRRLPPKQRGEEGIYQPPGEVVFGMRTGLFGHPTTTVLRVKDETIVGANEEGDDGRKELGEIVTQLGLLTAAALFNYNLAWGPDGLAKAMAKWAGIDVEALRKAAEEEAAAEEAAVMTETDEDGDTIVRTVEQPEAPAMAEDATSGDA